MKPISRLLNAYQKALKKEADCKIDSCQTCGAEVQTCHEKIESYVDSLVSDNLDYNKSFDLRWKADRRAIDRWRSVDPEKRNLMLPDHADLCMYLLEQMNLRIAEGQRLAVRVLELESLCREAGHALEEEARKDCEDLIDLLLGRNKRVTDDHIL